MSATEAWLRIRQLRPEFETKSALAKRLGYQLPQLQFGRQRVRLRTLLRLRHLAGQLLLFEPPDYPTAASL